MFNQALRMRKYYKTPFEDLLRSLFEIGDEYHIKFTFPITAKAALEEPENTMSIVREGHEVAAHGYRHVYYPSCSAKEVATDIDASFVAFRHELGINVKGFRAPYNCYHDALETFYILSEDYKYDLGYGRRDEFQRLGTISQMVCEDGNILPIYFFPLNRYSDDKMIDREGYDVDGVYMNLLREMTLAKWGHDIIMFDLHPIRIAQKEYIGALDGMLEWAVANNAWITTPLEVVNTIAQGKELKGDFTLLITGDIDQWDFWSYLRR